MMSISRIYFTMGIDDPEINTWLTRWQATGKFIGKIIHDQLQTQGLNKDVLAKELEIKEEILDIYLSGKESMGAFFKKASDFLEVDPTDVYDRPRSNILFQTLIDYTADLNLERAVYHMKFRGNHLGDHLLDLLHKNDDPVKKAVMDSLKDQSISDIDSLCNSKTIREYFPLRNMNEATRTEIDYCSHTKPEKAETVLYRLILTNLPNFL